MMKFWGCGVVYDEVLLGCCDVCCINSSQSSVFISIRVFLTLTDANAVLGTGSM